MLSIDELERVFLEHRPIKCERCHGVLKYTGSGKYECERCSHVMMDDFGKVKAYIEENGPTSVMSDSGKVSTTSIPL